MVGFGDLASRLERLPPPPRDCASASFPAFLALARQVAWHRLPDLLRAVDAVDRGFRQMAHCPAVLIPAWSQRVKDYRP